MKRKENSCRFCEEPLRESVIDLGLSPIANALVTAEKLSKPEAFHPLHVFVCTRCYLVQLPEAASLDAIFNDDYVYFSSFSDSWLKHAESYVIQMIERFGLSPSRQVIEIASNDGYLLQYFKKRGVPVLGIEPCGGVADAAEKKGIPTLRRFFGRTLAQELMSQRRQADLLIGNNVFAHVPDLHDFVAGLKSVLAPSGVLTLEFPHLLCLLQGLQFDTIYHEHFSYFSLATTQRVLAKHGLTVFDVEELSTHGGSLRVFISHEGNRQRAQSPRVKELLERESREGLEELATYRRFREQVAETKLELLDCLSRLRREGKRVAAYGAPAKGNTLLNYCGVRADWIEFTVDRNPHKQGRWLPGSRIPILSPEAVTERKPDYLLILPWNLRSEIISQMACIRDWGGRFIVPIPTAEILS